MLRIIISGDEFYNEETQEFNNLEDFVLELEHSLASLSKWESVFERPFLGSGPKDTSELIAYVKAMILNEDYPEDVLSRLSHTNLEEINRYIGSNQTATTFGDMPEQKHKGSGETITAELIYYWMVTFSIPFECETWHLNRLFSLVKVCNLKNNKPKKLSRREVAERNARLNAERRAQLGSSG